MIDSGAGLSGAIDPALAQRLNGLPQVQAATGVSVGAAKIFGRVEQIAAVDPRTAGQIFDVGALRGSISDLGATGIAVSKNVAQAQHLKLGDAVPALFKDTGLRKRLPQPGVSSRSVFEMKSVGIGRCRGRLRN